MTADQFRARFRREREAFAVYRARVADAGLGLVDSYCSPGSACRFRDVAWCDLPTNMVWFVRRALQLPADNLVALLRHELGHLADVHPERSGAEKRADRIAQIVSGQVIRYDKRALQTIGKGSKRPSWLHQ